MDWPESVIQGVKNHENEKILIFAVLALLIFSSTAYSAQTVTITIGFTKAASSAPTPAPNVDTGGGSSGGGGSSQSPAYEVIETENTENAATTDVTVKGDLTGKNITEVIQQIETTTEVKTLDLSSVTGVTEVKLPENTKIETLTITENTSIKKVEVPQNDSLKSINLSNSKVEEVNASECSGLETVEVENNEALVVLNVSYSSVTTLNAKNCVNLENLNCERCEITELNLEGCEKLSDLDCSYNSLTRLDVSSFSKLSNLACQGQTVRGFKRVQSFNLIDFLFRKISEFFLADYSEEELNELKYVQNIKAFDESGNEIKVNSDEQGNVTFSKAPAKITYDYDTGFNDVVMDVTVETAEEEIVEDGSSQGSRGGCNLMGNYLIFLFMPAVVFMKRRIFLQK